MNNTVLQEFLSYSHPNICEAINWMLNSGFKVTEANNTAGPFASYLEFENDGFWIYILAEQGQWSCSLSAGPTRKRGDLWDIHELFLHGDLSRIGGPSIFPDIEYGKSYFSQTPRYSWAIALPAAVKWMRENDYDDLLQSEEEKILEAGRVKLLAQEKEAQREKRRLAREAARMKNEQGSEK